MEKYTAKKLKEIINDSIVIYTQNNKLESEFSSLIKENLAQEDDEYFFLTFTNNLGKHSFKENSYEVVIYNYKIEEFCADLSSYDYSKGQNIFGNKSIKTGFKDFDERVLMFRGDFVVLASRPMMRKSTLVAQLCNNQRKEGYNLSVYSLESSKDDFYIKLVSQETSIPTNKLLRNDLDESEKYKVNSAYDEIRDSFCLDTTNYNLKGLITKIKKDYMTYSLDIVYIDYLQLIKSTSSLDNRYLELNQISRELKILAKELNILIIATSELNRNLESRYDKRPLLKDLRDSGTIEDDADKVIFLYKESFYIEQIEKDKELEAKQKGEEYKSHYTPQNEEDLELIIAKQNNGTSGTIHLKLINDCAKITDSNKNHELKEVFFESNSPEIL